jgi:hypothetical protein
MRRAQGSPTPRLTSSATQSSHPRKWWQWFLLYPGLLVSVIGSVPTYVELVNSHRFDVPFGHTFEAEEQNRLWEANFDCTQKASFTTITNKQRVEIGSFAICGLPIESAAIVIAVLALGILASPLATEAQQARRPYRIGVLHTAFFEEIPSVAGLKAGLKALGLEEGRDVTFDIRFTRGKLDEAPTVAAALVKSGVVLIFAQTEQSARPLKEATQTIPVVFAEVGDPVAANLVASVPHRRGQHHWDFPPRDGTDSEASGDSQSDVSGRPSRLGRLLRA